jgi:iron complex outermembrane receptor protein
MEAGADITLKKASLLRIAFYRNDINDWIQWVPVTAGYYSPQNIKKVRADGMESCFAFPVTVNSWKAKLEGSYTYSRSVNRSINQALSAEILNKQLIYIPQHAASGTITVSSKGLSFMAHYHYYGLRYTTADHSYFLPAYHLLQCALLYEHTFKKLQLQPYFRVSNLTDTSYQSMAWRPMPGSSFHFGLSISFHHKTLNT